MEDLVLLLVLVEKSKKKTPTPVQDFPEHTNMNIPVEVHSDGMVHSVLVLN